MDRAEVERLAIAMGELAARRAADPLLSWEPTEKQRPFVEAVLARRVHEAWFIAANRSGKSDAASYIGASIARFGEQHPLYGGGAPFRPTKGWVISATTNASRTVVQPKYFNNGLAAAESHPPFIPEREIKSWNINEQTLQLKNGSVIEFKTAEAKTITFAGAGLDWVQIDEEVEKHKFDEITIRVGGGRTLRIFGACTILPPEGMAGGVSWMFPEKIQPFMSSPGACDFEIYGASIYDNPHLLAEEIRRLEARYPEGSVERAIRLEGQYLPGLQGSRAYTAFDRRLHVRPQGLLIPRRPLCWMWDFNVEPMVSLVGQRDGDMFRIYKEFVVETDASIEEMVQYFVSTYPQHNGEIWIYGDSSGRKRTTTAPGGRSEYQVIVNMMRTYGAPVRLKVPEANPLVPTRLVSVNNQFKDEHGTSHVEIDPACKELIDDFEQVLRDNKGGIKKVSDRKNPYSKRTHPSDAFGYWVTFEAPVRFTRQSEKPTHAPKTPGYSFSKRSTVS